MISDCVLSHRWVQGRIGDFFTNSPNFEMTISDTRPEKADL